MSAALALGHLRKVCHHNFQDSQAKTTTMKPTKQTTNKSQQCILGIWKLRQNNEVCNV